MANSKMTFKLEPIEDGYPPYDYETVHVEDLGNSLYRVDNIPFYINNISPDDIVKGYEVDGILMYDKTVEKSALSVIRVVFFKMETKPSLTKRLESVGCKCEGSNLKNMISVEVPHRVALNSVRDILDRELSSGTVDYEESSLRV